MEDLIYELKDVYFSYLAKYPALCGININIRPGEKIAIIGANGSGKSTLLHMLDGLIFPSKGIVKAFGKELNENIFRDDHFSRSFRKRTGLVFQNPDVQLFCPTVKEDIIFGPVHLGVEEKKINERLSELVEMLGIKNLLDRSPHQLSVGEKRKVAIASTLAIDPDVLLLDEPTAGLDPLTIRHIMDFFMQATVAHKTIIIATHDLHFIEEISDIIYVFGPGKNIVKCGKVLDVLQDTALLETNNLIHVHAHRHKDTIHIHPHQHLHQHH